MKTRNTTFAALTCALIALILAAIPITGYSAGITQSTGNLTDGAIGSPMETSAPEALSGSKVQIKAKKVKIAVPMMVEVGERPPRDNQGSDGGEYQWQDSNEEGGPNYEWIDIRGIQGAQQLGASDDWNSGVIQLGFQTSWYGQNYDAIRVCSNGWITFDVNYEGTDYPLPQCPNTDGVNSTLAVLGYDIDPSEGGEMWFWSNGQDQAVIEWFQVPAYSGAMIQTMEIVINSNGTMVFQYGEFQNFDVNNVNVGFENQDGQTGASIAYQQEGISAGMAIAIQGGDLNPRRFDVPEEYGTIQAAIDATTTDGDTVLVQQGTYYENLVVNEGHLVNVFSNYALSGDANDIWNTILDGNNGRIMYVTGSDSPVHLKGLVIQNGVSNDGGAIATNSDLSLTICVLRDNHANVSGGAISAYGDVPKTITSANCTYANNNATDYGGVFFLNNVNLDSEHDLIFGNTAGVGGVLGQHNPPINISFNFSTVVDNSDNTGVGGMWNFGMYGDNGNNYPNHITIANSIFRNAGYEAANLRTVAGHNNIYDISYSDFDTDGGDHGILVQAAIDLNWGTGSFDADPQLDGNHVVTVNSPCIDAADPNADNDADGTRADMGYYYYAHEQGPRTRYVPSVYSTIQRAIDAASAGDNVLVAAGTYYENINFNGQNVTVTGDAENPANVVIDGGGNGAVVTFENEESNQAILVGFTITNGSGANLPGWNAGGGVCINNASTPLIQHCIITGNTADFDGGLTVLGGSNPTIEFCTISNNHANANDGGVGVHVDGNGGATFNDCSIISNHSDNWTGGVNVEGGCIVNMTRCIIADNSTSDNGGGMSIHGATVNLTNCVIYGNSSNDEGGAIYLNVGQVTLLNSIVWNNAGSNAIRFGDAGEGSTADISYSDVQGGQNVVFGENGTTTWGDGNINSNPLFVDAENGDFHLTAYSPCIDAGNPEGAADPNNSPVEMGAYFFDGVRLYHTWWILLGAHSANANDVDNWAGGAEGATENFDAAWDIPEPPHAVDNWVSLFFPHPDYQNAQNRKLSGDFLARDQFEAGTMSWLFDVQSDMAGQGISLSAGIENLPLDYTETNIGIVDLDNGTFDNLRENIAEQTGTEPFSFGNGGGIRHFRLIFNDVEGPEVEITAPTEDATIVCGLPYSIEWNATDIATIMSSVISVTWDGGENWEQVGEVDGNTFEFVWNFPGLVVGDATIRVASEDGFGNITEASVNVVVIDTPPEVTVTYPNGGEQFDAGETVHITWEQSDNIGVVGNRVHISSNDALGLDATFELEGVATSYDWVAPDIYSPFVVVTVTAIDGSNLEGADQSNGEFAVTPTRLVHEFGAGWSLFSIPLQNEDYSNQELFGDDIDTPFNLFNYSDGGFHWSGGQWGNDAITGETWRAVGYWMALNEGATVDVEGSASLGEYWWGNEQTGMELTPGWNLVGCPFPTSVPKSEVWFDNHETQEVMGFQDAVDAGWVLPVLYSYSQEGNSYQESDDLLPWQGFWIRSMYNLAFKMVPSRNNQGEFAPAFGDPTADDWRLYFSASMRGSSDGITHFGANSEASSEFDAWFDQPEPPNPPGSEFVSAYFEHNGWNNNVFGRRFNSDVRAPIQEGSSEAWTMTVITGDTGMVTLSWDNFNLSVPEGYTVSLIDADNEQQLNPAETESYEYFSSGSHQFNLVVSAPEAGPETRDLHVALRSGWNMISLNVQPGDEFYSIDNGQGPDIRLILDQLRDEQDNTPVEIFKDELGRFYVPRIDFNNIPFWNLSQGYQLKVNRSGELVQTGTQIPANTALPIETGWNLIAYYPDYQLSARAPDFEVVSPIIDNVLLAKDQYGQFMYPRANFSNMAPWTEGRGYQIKVNATVELTYPTQGDQIGAKAEGSTLPNLSHWTAPASSGRNMSLLLSGFAGIEVNPGDEVAAFDNAGTIVGWGTVDSELRCGLAVWGDDLELEGKQGLLEDEKFNLQLWQTALAKELPLDAQKVLEGNGLTYATDDFSAVETRAAAQIPLGFYLESAYPNPFNAATSISFGLPEKTNVKLSIVNIVGQTVAVLQSGEQEAGRYNLRWNAEALSSGVYFVKLEAGTFLAYQKVNLLK